VYKDIDYGRLLPKDSTMADTLYDRIEQHVKDAESDLAEDEALALYHFLPNGEALRVESVGYHNPYLMRFDCEDSGGNKCDVRVHFASTHLVLRRFKPETKKQRQAIGFVANS